VFNVLGVLPLLHCLNAVICIAEDSGSNELHGKRDSSQHILLSRNHREGLFVLLLLS